MSGIYVIGTDMTRFGYYPGRKVEELGAEAVRGALGDAGLSIRDMGALYCGNVNQASDMVGQKILRLIGQTGIAVTNCANACATGATAFHAAWMGLKAGLYDLVLALGVEQMAKGLIDWRNRPMDLPREGLLGSGTMPSIFAELGMEHARKWGTSFAQFAKVAVKNHYHATMNPKAMYRKGSSLEEVMQAEMISYPNTKLMCSVNVDGAAAAVLATEKKVRELGRRRAVRVRASVLQSAPGQERPSVLPDVNGLTRVTAYQAYGVAGIGPEELNLVELHDCFAPAELLHYENLLLCADGEAGRLIDSGETWLGGRSPVNVSGGLLAKGHPIGATGVANIYEVCQHLRGEAGERQVQGARLGLTHVIGLGGACAIHILERAG